MTRPSEKLRLFAERCLDDDGRLPLIKAQPGEFGMLLMVIPGLVFWLEVVALILYLSAHQG